MVISPIRLILKIKFNYKGVLLLEITNNTIINVCSYMPITIVASTSAEDYIFEPCLTDNPIIQPMSVSEVKEIHSKSKVFTDGWLTFEEEAKNDMYKYLRIKDGENILNQIEIMECIISGKKDDIAKLINIKSKGYFERVYGVYAALKQSNMYDISMRVAKAIEYRYDELRRGVINTQIELANTFNTEKTDAKDQLIAQQQASLKEQEKSLGAMNDMIAALQQQIAELTQTVSKTKSNNIEKEQKKDTENTTESAPKPRGRKPSTNKTNKSE